MEPVLVTIYKEYINPAQRTETVQAGAVWADPRFLLPGMAIQAGNHYLIIKQVFQRSYYFTNSKNKPAAPGIVAVCFEGIDPTQRR